MKILITGATGFLGSHLAHRFLAEGHELVLLKRITSDCHRINDIIPQVACYNSNLAKMDQLFVEQPGINVVVHAATTYGRHNESMAELCKGNTLFPLDLLESAIRNGVERFINADTSLSRMLNGYSLSKKQFQEWGVFFAHQERIRFLNIELEHFYGAGDDDSKFTTYVIRSFLANIPELKLTSGEQYRDFIHIDDVSAAFSLLLNTPTCGQYYQNYALGSGDAVTIREFVQTVHQLTNSNTHLLFGAVPYRDNEVMESVADTSAMKQLGWQCHYPLRKGLEMTIQQEKQSRGRNS